MAHVSWLTIAPVKGLALVEVDELALARDGVRAHEEDEWIGRRVQVGEAVVLLREQVARCAVTTQNPTTGKPDFDTLREIKAYRGARERKLIDFGVYGEVAEPGRVRLGDPVEPL